MYNVEILLIRACKSNNPEKRLASVYRRFFYSGKMETFDLLIILNNLCEKHLPIKSGDLLHYMNPQRDFMYNCTRNTPYAERALKVLISHIRLSSIENLKGFKRPCWIRNKNDRT